MRTSRHTSLQPPSVPPQAHCLQSQTDVVLKAYCLTGLSAFLTHQVRVARALMGPILSRVASVLRFYLLLLVCLCKTLLGAYLCALTGDTSDCVASSRHPSTAAP